MTTETNVKKTQQEYFNNFVNIYTELATLNEDIKQLSEEFKKYYVNVDLANLKKVSKIKAEQKIGESVERVNAFLEAVESYTQG